VRRPAPAKLSDIWHPGPKTNDRKPCVSCRAAPVSFDIACDQPLLEALGTWAASKGYSSAVLELNGLSLQHFDYVMPDRAIDDRHAAWYSDTFSSSGAELSEAVAVLGRRDGSWFAHIHAYWHENGAERLGHLLPSTLITAVSARVTGYGLKGAVFEAAPDPETEFTLFRVKQDLENASVEPDNALIATLAPFEDLHDSVAALAEKLDTTAYEVKGLGSLAGACFHETRPMTGLISEILLLPGAGATREGGLTLPIRGIDLDGNLHVGSVLPHKAPTLVTCELLIRRRDTA